MQFDDMKAQKEARLPGNGNEQPTQPIVPFLPADDEPLRINITEGRTYPAATNGAPNFTPWLIGGALLLAWYLYGRK